MATEIQQTRYDATMRRVGDLKGAGAKVSNVLAELFPVVDLEQVPGELLLLGGTHIAFAGSGITAAAGQFAAIMLFNPLNSRQLVTVSSVLVSSANTQSVFWSLQSIELATPVNSERIRDGRLPITAPTAARISEESKIAATGATAQARLLANQTLRIEDPNGVAVLSPGVGLEFGITTAATSIFCTFYWRERAAEPSELNL